MAELKTFLFTDICRSVDLKNEMAGRSVTERDQAFIETILIPHRQRIEAHLEEQGGRVVSTAGDGHFLVFDNTVRAAQWAVDVQRDHRDNPIGTPGDGHVEVRVSIHVGVPQVDPADPYNFVGKSVDYASRLNDYAQGSQILVSRSVMAILHDVGLEGIAFHLHGRRQLKGIGHVEVHELLYDKGRPVNLRQRPSTHSDRQWTVLPTEGFDPSGSTHLRSTAVAPLQTPKQIGNYELEERLGSGGMGDVYKGRHTQFGRVRAIKVIKPQFVASDNQDVINRFYREIRAIGALEHKNIVVAIDSSQPNDHVHYLVMEFIEGVSLLDLVDQVGFLDVADACEVVRQAARGLQYIHRNSMVHRDIKPSNLMLTLVDSDGMATESSQETTAEGVHGVVKILDLGLALLSEDQHDRLTRYDNKAMGTGMYMSPEQWKTTSVDIRADIYSLGCTLYHLLAGNPPFSESDLRPEKAHEKSKVPPIRAGATVPRKLWDVIQKMMAKKPEDRYATPADVTTALLPFCEGHDLAALVQEYIEPEGGSSANRLTRSDSGARIDTWLSRASHLYPTRRWLLNRGLPLFLIGAAFAGLLWSMQQNREDYIDKIMQSEKVNLLKFAEEVAKDHVGKEISDRFSILLAASHESDLIKMVKEFDESEARSQGEAYPLAQWIRGHRTDNMDDAFSSSWFINDSKGTQIARHPIVDKKTGQLVSSFMKDLSYRDYFHGEERDREKNKTAGVTPITEPNISAVYISSSSGQMKVAFSVPIFDIGDEVDGKAILGVLSMSFELGAFKVSGNDLSYFEGKQIVFVDMRRDYLEGEPKQGLILNHQHQGIWQKETPPRVPQQVIQAMSTEGENFIAGYKDPLSLNKQATYWGAFKPIYYYLSDPKGGTRKVASGSMVLVQTEAKQ